jgi:DNA invertase Pin-like site-specific DNA recombinase
MKTSTGTTQAKAYVALARVSSREQEREGFSLDVQEEALRRFAEQNGGTIVKMYRVAETASKAAERTVFNEMLEHCVKHAGKLAGLLVYKVDRAARNLPDYVRLQEIEQRHGVPLIVVSQPTTPTPAGRMSRGMMALMATYFADQLASDVREGHQRRVKAGWFCNAPPFGYRSIRENGRAIVRTEEHEARLVRKLFDLYATGIYTLDTLRAKLVADAETYRGATAWPRSQIHKMLSDRAYIGQIRYHGEFYEGRHEKLVDFATFERVQELLGGRQYKAHEMTFAGELVDCGHCGRPITGERIGKRLANGTFTEYTYYRCSRYNAAGHPRVRVREEDLGEQFRNVLGKLKLAKPEIAEWFKAVLAERAKHVQQENKARRAELQRQVTLIAAQQDKLLNLRLEAGVSDEAFNRKHQELADRLARTREQLAEVDLGAEEHARTASEVFELAQMAESAWVLGSFAVRRQILDLVCLNYRLVGKNLQIQLRKPFDLLAEAVKSEANSSSWTRIEPFVRDVAGLGLHHRRRITELVRWARGLRVGGAGVGGGGVVGGGGGERGDRRG